MTPQTVYTIWWVSIVLLLIITAVVALLLALILATARTIEQAAGEIWTVGKLVANNTIHIPLLAETNRTAVAILNTAVSILDGATAIESHAQSCPACPQCAQPRTERTVDPGRMREDQGC